MDKWDLIEQAFFDGTFDAAWNESEHPREGDALRKRGAAVNRSPIRHHGGRVPKAKDAFGSRISGALRGAVSGAKAGRQATGQRIAGTMAGGVGGAMHGWRGAPIVPRLNNRSAALMSAKAQRR